MEKRKTTLAICNVAIGSCIKNLIVAYTLDLNF